MQFVRFTSHIMHTQKDLYRCRPEQEPNTGKLNRYTKLNHYRCRPEQEPNIGRGHGEHHFSTPPLQVPISPWTSMGGVTARGGAAPRGGGGGGG
jgi:hypothetical protein